MLVLIRIYVYIYIREKEGLDLTCLQERMYQYWSVCL